MLFSNYKASRANKPTEIIVRSQYKKLTPAELPPNGLSIGQGSAPLNSAQQKFSSISGYEVLKPLVLKRG
jgi:hypothetical protein